MHLYNSLALQQLECLEICDDDVITCENLVELVEKIPTLKKITFPGTPKRIYGPTTEPFFTDNFGVRSLK